MIRTIDRSKGPSGIAYLMPGEEGRGRSFHFEGLPHYVEASLNSNVICHLTSTLTPPPSLGIKWSIPDGPFKAIVVNRYLQHKARAREIERDFKAIS